MSVAAAVWVGSLPGVAQSNFITERFSGDQETPTATPSSPTARLVAPVDTAASAVDIASAIAADPSVVRGAAWVAKPPIAGSSGLASTALVGFPTSGPTFGMLSSGNVSSAFGTTQAGNISASLGGNPVRGNSDLDVTILRIDVEVPAASNCLVGLDFRFMSEEFPEYVNSRFNDAFIAEVDSSTWMTSGSTIVAPRNFAFDPSGRVVSINSTGATAMTAAEAVGTIYDGATPLLRAATPISPGLHSIYLSIFDQGDRVLDSTVLIDNLRFGRVRNVATDCKPGATVADDVDWDAWTTGDVHAHAAGDTSLAIHPSCVGLSESACANRLVRDVSSRVNRFDTDWIILTEHAPWLGFLRKGQVGVYGLEQGERQWNFINGEAGAASGANNVTMLTGLELGTAAPACMRAAYRIEVGWRTFEAGFDQLTSPGHFGVYSTPSFIDNSIFDCRESGPNSYPEDTQAVGFGGMNHPKNRDGGSPWHCWNTRSTNADRRGLESQPNMGVDVFINGSPMSPNPVSGTEQCFSGIDNYGQRGTSGTTTTGSNASFRSMEIISGDNLPAEETLQHWDALLQNGYVVAAVGGGDGHTAPRKQNAAGVIQCLKDENIVDVTYKRSPPLVDVKVKRADQFTLLACSIDRGGEVKDPSVAKIGGSGRTLVAASKAQLAAASAGSPTHAVRTAISQGRTVATNGPKVMARIGSSSPGDTARTTSSSVTVRVDWLADFKHAGDSPQYCEGSARRVEPGAKTKICPTSFRFVTFNDIATGQTGQSVAPKNESEAPDEVRIKIAPVVACGVVLSRCAAQVTELPPIVPTATDIANGYINVNVPLPTGAAKSYVRAEAYYNTGSPNTTYDAKTKTEVPATGQSKWDFAALTSPIFVERTGPALAASPAAKQAAAAVASPSPATVNVVDLYGAPVPGITVMLEPIDTLGTISGPALTSLTSGSGQASFTALPAGDWAPSATGGGCDVAAATPFSTPAAGPITILLDCYRVDDQAPTVTVNGPGALTASGTAEFTLAGNDNLPGVRVICMLDEVDGDDFALVPCDNLVGYVDLAPGRHVFQVVAMDVAGNYSDVKTVTFFVEPSGSSPRACAICVGGPSGTTLTVTGNARVDVANGALEVRSTGPSSISAKGQGQIRASTTVRTIGGVLTTGQATVTPTASPNLGPDPAPRTIPLLPALPSGSCSISGTPTSCPGATLDGSGQVNLPDGGLTELSMSGAARVSIGPGRYDRIDLSGQSQLTLRPGTYFIRTLSSTGSSIVTGRGVLVFLTCGGCANPVGLNATGSSTVGLEGTHPAVLAGDALVVDGVATVSVSGQSAIRIIGNLVASGATVNLSGGSRLTVSELVARTIDLAGNSVLESRYD